jgi:hypothetical protein
MSQQKCNKWKLFKSIRYIDPMWFISIYIPDNKIEQYINIQNINVHANYLNIIVLRNILYEYSNYTDLLFITIFEIFTQKLLSNQLLSINILRDLTDVTYLLKCKILCFPFYLKVCVETYAESSTGHKLRKTACFSKSVSFKPSKICLQKLIKVGQTLQQKNLRC